MKTLVLGIGNDILGDDAVGIHIAREISKKIHSPDIEVKETGATGLNLIETVSGYDRLIVIDAILSNKPAAGQIHRLELKDLDAGKTITPHEASLQTTLELGDRLFPGQMPQKVVIFGVQIQDVEEITINMTPAVKAAIPKAIKMIINEIKTS